MGENQPSDRKLRVRKLTIDDRLAICELYNLGTFTMEKLGEMFGVSQPRVSQIVRDTYGEMMQIVRNQGE